LGGGHLTKDIGTMSGRDHCQSSKNSVVQGMVSVAEILRYIAEDRYLAEREARQYLSLSERNIRNHLGEIKHYRVGQKLLFKKSDLDRWMDRYVEPSNQLDLHRLADEVLKDVFGAGNN
jgi:excisionase family DNA binding protein